MQILRDHLGSSAASLLATAAVVSISSIAPRTASAQTIDRVEVIPIQTSSPTAQQFLSGDKSARTALIAGYLRIPKPGSEKLRAVVLLHGGSGIHARHERWAQELNAAGLATFVVDSFSGRGIVNALGDQSQLSHLAMMVDAYRALAILRQHPRIDPNGIAVMGFSKGAVGAVYSALERFHRMYGPADARFAAHIGLYTPCNTAYREDEKVTQKPIRLFHGTVDDWVSIAPCRAYVERLKKAGADVTLTEFPGAHHAYDNFTLTKPVAYPQVQTAGNCLLRESDGGMIVNAKTGKPFDYNDPCVEKSPHVAYNAAAHEATVAAVKELLTTKVGAR